MSNCADKRTNCGTTLASACVVYTGEDLSQVNQETLPCNPNVNDILLQLNTAIATIKTATDIAGIDVSCLDNCICGELTLKEYIQLLADHVCTLESQVKQLQAQLGDLGAVKFNINLSAFNNSYINGASNKHSLIEVLNLLITEVLTLKNSN